MCFPEWLEAAVGGKYLQVKEGCFQFVRTLYMPLHISHALPRVPCLGKKSCAALATELYCSYIGPAGSGEQ